MSWKNINFAEITGKHVSIKHFSTASVIQIIFNPTDPEEDYSQFESLVDVIQSLEHDEDITGTSSPIATTNLQNTPDPDTRI